jgi:hypothetical protein
MFKAIGMTVESAVNAFNDRKKEMQMDDIKNADWCRECPNAAAEEIKRLEAALRHSNAQMVLLQDACRECASVANKVAADLAAVHAMLKEKGL